jgi:hypothetical protein
MSCLLLRFASYPRWPRKRPEEPTAVSELTFLWAEQGVFPAGCEMTCLGAGLPGLTWNTDS